ncbi:long-chain-fatty-acid--CoA ligase [Streptomyces radicis]|uniref:Long-chain-fatty-acid--CoA ligase n=1 Tax=Streptomyces radicis TaxID=1750517 RepID=A0A3A9WHU5_9ACTN|nr:long-chain-fatty-acid--CoA ligase [Streptomyces radicis]RKN12588.1 long-chain-fatty-acid--CoA ligase [Streptomyces radicis]RKN27648.1 long-chain-fatty-acid--CoA ligase [Streptomyces radicis]
MSGTTRPGGPDVPRFPTLSATAAHHARARPDAVAVECEGRAVTFLEFHRRGNRTAHALIGEGVAPGTRVAYLGRDSEHYHELLLGCARTGAVLVPADPRLTPGEVAHVLSDSGAELLFADQDHLATVAALRPRLDGLRNVVALTDEGPEGFAAWRDGHPDTDPDPDLGNGPGAPLAQLYTSGTTGAPKGVVLAQSTFWAINDLLARHALDWLDWRPDDRSLNVLPGHHIGGPWWFLQGFRAGATNVVARGFDARRTLRWFRDGGITTTLVVPSMLTILLAEPGVGPGDFTGLRKVVYGGSPMPETLLKQCLEVMGCDFAQIYGLTETCASAVCLPPADHVPGGPRLRAAGRPYPGVAVQAVDRSGAPLPPGEVGELRIDTPALMDGYWRRPAETARTVVDGWLLTGDAGHVDEDGYVFLHDRIKDTVLVAGENVYPAEVEAALRAHPGVADAAVIGVPHDVRGEAVRACVVARPGAAPTPRELITFLRGVLADYKIPTSFEFLDELPRNASGKVLRRHLRDRAREKG